MRRIALDALVLGAVLAAPLAAQDGTGWRVERLDLDLSVVPEDRLLVVEGTLALRLDAERSRGPVLVMRDLGSSEFIVQVDGHLAEPHTVSTPDRLARRLRFDEELRRGDELEVRFAYEVRIARGQILVDPACAFGSWVENWYPAPTSSDPASTRNRTAPGTTTLRLPPDWSSVANGALVGRTEEGGEAVEVWSSEQAVARSFAAGPYRSEWYESDGRRVGVFFLAERPGAARDQAEILSRALDAMERHFGPYPYPTYVIAEVPTDLGSFGASSEQGFILCKPSFLEVEGGNLPLFAHEAAHGWWGNLVNQRGTGSILCSESLAQYGAVLAIEAIEGPQAATEFLRFSRPTYVPIQCARGYFELARNGNDEALSKLTGGGWQHNLADAKGHWVYHMLRGRLGDERFFATLRGLIDEFAGRAMALDDVRAAFVAADDDPDGMRRFLAQWLDRKGAPVIEAELEAGALVLRQVQEGEPYELALEVDLVAADGGVETLTVDVAERTTRIPLEAGAGWREAQVDPRHRLLVWQPEYGARPAR